MMGNTSGELSVAERQANFDENFADIKARVAAAAKRSGRDPAEITLLAATKTIDVAVINHAIENGLTAIGENRVQEFRSKEDALLPAADRHFIGHLQSNKVRDIVGRVSLIHSVHSVKLASVISNLSQKQGIITDILLEVNIGGEESKSGFAPDALAGAVAEIAKMPGISIKGLMTIPPICDDSAKNRRYFQEMYHLFLDIRGKKIDNSNMEILSMGMSDDFETAIEEGATLIRVGTALFGKRNYSV